MQSYFDSDDVARLLESHFEDLSTGAAADLTLTDQVCHLCWIPLNRRHRKKNMILDQAQDIFTGEITN